jgi:hypothetical protein
LVLASSSARGSHFLVTLPEVVPPESSLSTRLEGGSDVSTIATASRSV